MNNKSIFIQAALLIIFLQSCLSSKPIPGDRSNHTWTFTYIKAKENQKELLKEYIEKNWFVMDSIAAKRGLLGKYELYENQDARNKDWDFIVAVEYLTPAGYDAVANAFEQIRAKHQVVRINGLGMKELGTVVQSQTVRKYSYPQ